jgi:hypothetical protein
MEEDRTEDTDDIRAALESAIDTQADDTPAQVEQDTQPEPEQDDDRPRDESGRFAPKHAGEVAAKAHEGRVAESVQANSAAMNAPASWKPDAREHWANTPEPIRNEALRRESDFNRAWQDSAPIRQLGAEIQKVVAPYAELIEREGSTPVQAIASLLDTRARLNSADPVTRAHMGAAIVKEFGIDISLLDSALANQPMPQPAADPMLMHQMQKMIEQKIAPIQQVTQTFEQFARQQSERQTAEEAAKIETFASSREHMANHDIREAMADILELADRRKFPITLEQAYNQACSLHPEISKIMIARSTSSSAQQQRQAAQRSRSAAVSVSGSPTGIAGEQTPGDDIRSHLEAAMTQVER